MCLTIVSYDVAVSSCGRFSLAPGPEARSDRPFRCDARPLTRGARGFQTPYPPNGIGFHTFSAGHIPFSSNARFAPEWILSLSFQWKAKGETIVSLFQS